MKKDNIVKTVLLNTGVEVLQIFNLKRQVNYFEIVEPKNKKYKA